MKMRRAVQLLLPVAVSSLGAIWIASVASAQQARKVDDAALKDAASYQLQIAA